MVLEKSLLTDVNAGSDEEGWQILFYYNIYRLGLTVLLLAIASPVLGTFTVGDNVLGLLIPAVGIASLSLITFITIQRRWPALYVQAHVLFLLDIVFITMLTFSRQLLDSSTLILYVTTAEEAKIAEASDMPSVEVLDRAVPADHKSRPVIRTNMSIAGCTSIALGILVAFFIEYLARLKQNLQRPRTLAIAPGAAPATRGDPPASSEKPASSRPRRRRKSKKVTRMN